MPTITLKLRGGTWNGSTNDGTITATAGSNVTIQNPIRRGYVFSGWVSANGYSDRLDKQYFSGMFTESNLPSTAVHNSGSVTPSLIDNDLISGKKSCRLTINSGVGRGTGGFYIPKTKVRSLPSSSGGGKFNIIFEAKIPWKTYFMVFDPDNNLNYILYVSPQFGNDTFKTYCFSIFTKTSGVYTAPKIYVVSASNEDSPQDVQLNLDTAVLSNTTCDIRYCLITTSELYSEASGSDVYNNVPSSGDTLYAVWTPSEYGLVYNNGGGVFPSGTNNIEVNAAAKNLRPVNPLSQNNQFKLAYSSFGYHNLFQTDGITTVNDKLHATRQNSSASWIKIQNPTQISTIVTSFSAAATVPSLSSNKSYPFKSWTITGMDPQINHYYWGNTVGATSTAATTVSFTGTSVTLSKVNYLEGDCPPVVFSNLSRDQGSVLFTANWESTPTYTSITLPSIPSKTGYKINGGWRTGSTTGTQVGAAGASYTPTASTTLYAGYTPNIATIQFHINGGTITTDTTATTRYRVYNNIVQRSTDSGVTWSNLTNTITSDVTTNYNLYNIGTYGATRDGYFYGSSTANVVNASYRVGSTTGTIISADDGDVNPATVNRITGRTDSLIPTNGATYTLYINWVAKATYTISYNANGGSGAPGNQTKTHGVNVTLSTTKPTRNGYWFAGWSTSSTAIDPTAAYNPGSTYSTNANLALYAVWWKCSYIYDLTWKPAIPYIYTGSAWQRSEPYVYDGSDWR